MAKLLRMPEVAANAVEAVLQDWTVEVGATYTAEDTLATVETEKAVVDVEAEEPGVLLRTLVPAGAQVEVGAAIALLGDPGEEVGDLDELLSKMGVVSTAPAVAPERRIVADDPEGGTAQTQGNGTQPNADRSAPDRIFSSPLARRLAREAGLAVEEISGSGPRGRIVRRDVESAIASRSVVAPAAPATPRPAPMSAPAAGATDVPHSRMRRAIAARLTESKQTVPHFYVRATVRVDKLLRLRGELNDDASTKVSVNDLVVKAVARAHTLVPEMNVIWTPDAVRQFSSVDISVAVASDRGLVTPVLRGVESMSVTTVATTVRDLVERARTGQLRQDELEGGAFGVTNLGMLGTEEFAAIINPPQSAILAVGAAREEPVVRKGKVRAGTVMRVTLSVDHRAVDGTLAARWMAAFVSLMEKPVRILA